MPRRFSFNASFLRRLQKIGASYAASRTVAAAPLPLPGRPPNLM